MIALPSFVDKEAWAGFVEMRNAIRKPLTPRAEKMILAELYRLRDAGHDPNAALDQSTNHCWADVYQPKAKEVEKAPGSAADETRRYLDEQERHRQQAQQGRLRRIA